YSTTDPTRYTRYARWKIDDDGSLTGWDNYYLGYAALNLVVESGVVAGRVMEGDVPVEGAVVTLRSDNVEYYGTADAEGAFSIDVLQTGRDYTAVAEADAFVGADASVTFADGMSQTLDIAMLPTKADFFGGVYEAVVLPEVSEAPAGTYYVFEAVEGNVLVFQQLTSMADLSADVPYIVAPEADATADLSALTFGRVAGCATVGGTAFQGTYASRALRDGEYLPSDLIAVEGDASATRSADAGKIARASGAYVATDILNPVIALRGSVSGIENVAADAQGSGAVYTIDGRLVRADGSVEGLPAGIYLVNGRKVAVK
ncbi:MAG: carboxypeptidase-like regulatory domain-containing protein, partial [Muribaculaceae bacterium]|nr:carboxypeptidase-like regulatory domain-containing protein [Muribaculaceae bacterium]